MGIYYILQDAHKSKLYLTLTVSPILLRLQLSNELNPLATHSSTCEL